MAGYYDYVLGAIPLSMGIPTVVLTLSGMAATSAIIIGSLLSVAIVGHAMFIRSPTDIPPASSVDSHSSEPSSKASSARYPTSD